jgi:hypothetical protein
MVGLMGLLESLASGLMGFAAGGPLMGGATFLSSLLGDDRPQGTNLRRPVNLDYLDVVRRNAAFQGYQQGYSATGPGVQQGQSGGSGTSSGGTSAGLSQFANQRGGQGNRANPAQGMAGNLGRQEAGTVNLQEAYRSYLGNALIGRDTVPNAQAAQFQAGLQTVDAQTQRARESFLQSMSQRGMTNSGMTGMGLAEIASGRATSLGQLSADLERQRQSQLLQAQQNAAAAMGQQNMQQAGIAAAQPTTGQNLGSLLGAYTQYQAVQNAPQMPTELFNPAVMAMLTAAGWTPPQAPGGVTPMLPGQPAQQQPVLPQTARRWWQWY